MINLIKAELYRYTKKKSLLILLGLFSILLLFVYFQVNDKETTVMFLTELIKMAPMLIGIYLFSIIYGDDLRAKSSQSSIGFGYSRASIIISKLLTGIIMTCLIFIYVMINYALMAVIFNLNINADIRTIMGHNFILSLILIISFFSLASVFAFLTQKSTFGIITYILLASGFVNNILGLIFKLQIFKSIFKNLNDYTVTNSINTISNLLNNQKALTVQPVLTLITFLVISTTISIIVYKNVELEF